MAAMRARRRIGLGKNQMESQSGMRIGAQVRRIPAARLALMALAAARGIESRRMALTCEIVARTMRSAELS